jgi:cytochrome c peroxidase
MRIAKILALGLLVFVTSCSNSETPKEAAPAAPATPEPPKVLIVNTTLGDMEVPPDNPITDEKVALGKMLFFDKRLSKSGKTSCETCHLPEKGWTDGKALSTKDDGSVNTRHTPTLYNVGFYKQWYWDGRAATLEKQINAAWGGQMGADDETKAKVAMTLNGIEAYKAAFEKGVGGEATAANIPMALAAFVRTLRSEDAPWDKYEKGDKEAVSAVARAGFQVFRSAEKANCSLCHVGAVFTDTLFHNVGVGFDKAMPDMGRGKILADANDPTADSMMGAFKTPTLRSITETAPYFHDGQAKTLAQAVDFMLAGGVENPHRDEKLKKREISKEEKMALIEFFKTLTPEKKPFERPTLP